jgi:hypothetical protein
MCATVSSVSELQAIEILIAHNLPNYFSAIFCDPVGIWKSNGSRLHVEADGEWGLAHEPFKSLVVNGG